MAAQELAEAQLRASLLERLLRPLVPLQSLDESTVSLLLVGVKQAAAAGGDGAFGRSAGPVGLSDEHVEGALGAVWFPRSDVRLGEVARPAE
ncbi:MAG: hypothetical protein ACT4NP_06195 [Pseudonocardiales bacterium]